MAHDVGDVPVGRRGVGGWVADGDPVAELAEGHRRAVAVQDVEAESQQVAPQAIGHALQVGRGPSLEVTHPLRPQFDPVIELVEQAALAQAGVADDGDAAAFGGGHNRAERFLQRGQFGVAADHARLDALDAAGGGAEGARLGPQHDIDRHRLLPAAYGQRAERLHVEDTTHVAVGVVGHQHAAQRRGLLQPVGQVHGVAHGRVFARQADAP